MLDSVSFIASTDVFCQFEIPSFDNSAMDGFALKSFETALASEQNPITFEVLACLAAGDPSPKKSTHSMSAFEIMTGAAFPEGYDCCAKIEDCEVTRDVSGSALKVTIRAPLNAKKNLRPAGHDFQKGVKLLSRGDTIKNEHVLALASVGHTQVDVYSPLKVALIATGKELVRYDEVPETWQIRNSTQPF